MHIRLNIEMRCARRQNDAAYQQYRRRSVSGRHAIIIHRRQVQHQSSRGMFLTLWMARMPLRHRPIVLRSPVNGSESAIGRGCIRATGWDAFLLKPLLRVPYVYSAYRTQPKYTILTSTPNRVVRPPYIVRKAQLIPKWILVLLKNAYVDSSAGEGGYKRFRFKNQLLHPEWPTVAVRPSSSS
jgi:hypothetical protein